MQQEAALACQHQRVDDPEHGIDRIRIGGLADSSLLQFGVPLGAEVAALEQPLPSMPKHPDIVVGRCVGRRREIDGKLVVRVGSVPPRVR
jgi:hypothetical protein